MGWCIVQWKMLLFSAKTIVKESCKPITGMNPVVNTGMGKLEPCSHYWYGNIGTLSHYWLQCSNVPIPVVAAGFQCSHTNSGYRVPLFPYQQWLQGSNVHSPVLATGFQCSHTISAYRVPTFHYQ